ncbi:MAG TPA: peptide chain release factor 1 [Candidatus Cloacimonadota bacterium]|jgi:peptide chain release factor 1|nr:peptide chain release factor 1 [Candidatus Cloacimonadales bacterium]HPY96816.1 peptide chain release factor 1 [Candidatus Cloacimonadota bacterium]HQB41376.1 peptide chain release factor 1 [Candidatus Cloacimonadota bacterium]
MIPETRLKALQTEYDELKEKVIDPSLMSDQRSFKKLSRHFNEINAILTTYYRLKSVEQEIIDSKDMIHNESDEELVLMAKEELEEKEKEHSLVSEELKDLLAPKDPNDDKNAIVEIRAGTGGEEAALFVSDLYRMYTRFAEINKWKIEIITSNPTGLGGFKEIIFLLSGDNVYGKMRFESGVHRVQRIPDTEANGRIHTSAISVAVLPEAEDIDVQIEENDLRIDVYRSSGNGGQSVNTTDSAVRITHIPSGIVVTCQDEKSQHKNKAKALTILKSRLLDAEISKQEAEISQSRKSQVGTGDRSAKIRTYNFPQSRITDHRINLTSYRLSGILDGELDEFIDALKIAYKNERLGQS